VFMSTTLNTGHVHGRGVESIVLPVRARDEEPEATTQESMFNFVRMSDGGPARYEGPLGEVQVISAIARRVLGEGSPVDFVELEKHSNLRAAIAAIVPGYEPMSTMDATKKEFHVEGRVRHDAKFTTLTERARFHAPDAPVHAARGPRELSLMTIRSEGQFNTVVYEEEDVYRGVDRRDVIMMAGADIARLGLRIDDRVTVRSEVGEMSDLRVREIAIRAGNAAMYYPEANVLVPARIDPESRTPAFKHVRVTVEKRVSLPMA